MPGEELEEDPEPKLDECPFCGSTELSLALHDNGESVWYVQCDCGAQGPKSFVSFHEGSDDAAEAWNRRV